MSRDSQLTFLTDAKFRMTVKFTEDDHVYQARKENTPVDPTSNDTIHLSRVSGNDGVYTLRVYANVGMCRVGDTFPCITIEIVQYHSDQQTQTLPSKTIDVQLVQECLTQGLRIINAPMYSIPQHINEHYAMKALCIGLINIDSYIIY